MASGDKERAAAGSPCSGVIVDACGPAKDMRALRKKLKNLGTGTGDVVRAIEASTFNLTERGFTMLIISCRRSSRWRKAMEIFSTMKGEKMRCRGIRPNFYTYSSLISVCCSAGACTQALGVLEEMREAAKEDPAIKPDATVYNNLIDACHRHHRPTDVLNLYETMCEDKANEMCKKTLISVVEACGALEMWERAFDLMDMLAELGIAVPLATYTQLLAVCADQGAVSTAVEVFLAMQMAGVGPDQAACHHMAHAAAAAQDSQMCLELVSSMQEAGMPACSSTFSCILAFLCQQKLWEAAMEVCAIVRAQGDTTVSDKWDAVLMQAGKLKKAETEAM